MDIEIQKVIENVRIIDSNRSYWFIRTYGGEMFKDFINRKYVGVGFNSVPYKFIEDCKTNDKKAFNKIKSFIERNTKYKKGEATKWVNQLVNFQHNAKIGDLVIIPNKNSSYFHIGVIESDVYLVNENQTFYHNKKYEKFPDKRRKVRWEKTISRHDMRNDLRGMTSTHQAITNIDKYSEQIEGYISSIFIRENKMHLIVKVNQDEDINAFHLNDFLSSITYFYKEFCKDEGEESEDLTIKIQLQSKGKTMFKAAIFGGVIGLAGLIALSNNNEFKATVLGTGITFKSDGIFNTISDFLDRNQERKMRYEIFQDSIKNLKVNVQENQDQSIDNDPTDNSIEKGETDNGEDNGEQTDNPN